MEESSPPVDQRFDEPPGGFILHPVQGEIPTNGWCPPTPLSGCCLWKGCGLAGMQPNRHKHADLVYIPTSHSPGTSGAPGCFTLRLRIRSARQDPTGVQPVATLCGPHSCPGTGCAKPSCFPPVCPLPGQWVQGRVSGSPCRTQVWVPMREGAPVSTHGSVGLSSA